MNIAFRSLSTLTLLCLSGCGLPLLNLPWVQEEKSSVGYEIFEPPPLSGPPPLVPSTEPVQLINKQYNTDLSHFKSASPNNIEACEKQLNLKPIEEIADPTNFGERHLKDFQGRFLINTPQLIVIHETVMSGQATLNLFQTPHPRDQDQVSYHMLIEEDGSLIRVVPDAKRAYGAGMSAFGDFTQYTKANTAGSINNIALHISLVSPFDGRGDQESHSGYTNKQYSTLAKQVLLWQATFGIPMTRVTTHQAVDRSHSKYDPRSFNWKRFDNEYKNASKTCGLWNYDNGKAGF